MPNLSIPFNTINVRKILQKEGLENDKPMEESLHVHDGGNLYLNQTLRKFQYEVKKFQKRRLDGRQKRHNLRYRLTSYDDSVPLLSVDFLDSKL